MLNGQKNVEVGAFKGERVERWKSEKMAFKGERVKKWKGEKMAAHHRWASRPNVAKKLERLVLLVLLESLENLA